MSRNDQNWSLSSNSKEVLIQYYSWLIVLVVKPTLHMQSASRRRWNVCVRHQTRFEWRRHWPVLRIKEENKTTKLVEASSHPPTQRQAPSEGIHGIDPQKVLIYETTATQRGEKWTSKEGMWVTLTSYLRSASDQNKVLEWHYVLSKGLRANLASMREGQRGSERA